MAIIKTVWGCIGGDLDDQYDLKQKLTDKVDKKWDTSQAGKILAINSSGEVIAQTGGSGTTDYEALSNKPQINSVSLLGNKTSAELGLLKNNFGTAESGKYLKIDTNGDVITAAGGGGGTTDYEALSNKPQINSVLLSGNKTLSDIGALKNNFGTSEAGKYLKIDTDGNVIAATSTVTFANVTGDITGNSALTTALAGKINKSTTSEPCEFGVTASGDIYVDLL